MDISILKDCKSEDREIHYVSESFSIKREMSSEEFCLTSSIEIKEECISKVDEQFYTELFPTDHVKTEPIEKFDDCNITEEKLDIQHEEDSVPSDVTVEKENNTLGNLTFKCEKCNYETSNKNGLDKHILFAKHILHECSVCGYKTSRIGNYKRHLLSHKSKKSYVHKCLECQFKTIDEFAIYKHMAEHATLKNREPSTCQQCSFGTFDQFFESQIFQKNQTTIISEVKECYYQKCHKDDKVHVFCNESIKEVVVYKCSDCKYQTARKGNLRRHMLRHKNRNELEMFGCAECSYQSFNKSHLQTHMLIHKKGDEVTLYRCLECDYQSKYKCDVKVHVLRHKNKSELMMFKCTECSYQAIRKCDLNRHLMRHKSVRDVARHQCPRCTYRTFDKGNLNKHIHRHKMGKI